MSATHHNRLFDGLIAARARFALRRHFSSILVRGSLPRTRAPLLVAVQHVSWWDPVLLFHVVRTRLDGEHVVMTDEASLQRLPFVGWLDAIEANRRQPIVSLRSALRRLHEPFARLWVTPAGRMEHGDSQQVSCERFADWLAMRARVPVVAVALRYDAGEQRRPIARVSFGDARMVDRAGGVQSLLADEVERLRNDALAGRSEGYDRSL